MNLPNKLSLLRMILVPVFMIVLALPQKEDILQKLSAVQTVRADYRPFGDGHSGEKIVELLIK